MEVQGSIKVIGEVQEISATFKKRELVLTTDEQYHTKIVNRIYPGQNRSFKQF